MWGEGRALWETSGLSAESRPLGFAAGPVLNSQLSPGPLLDTCLPWAFTGCLPPLGPWWARGLGPHGALGVAWPGVGLCSWVAVEHPALYRCSRPADSIPKP